RGPGGVAGPPRPRHRRDRSALALIGRVGRLDLEILGLVLVGVEVSTAGGGALGLRRVLLGRRHRVAGPRGRARARVAGAPVALGGTGAVRTTPGRALALTSVIRAAWL